MRGVFAVLVDAPEPVPASQVIKLTAERVPPTPFEQEGLPKHQNIRRFDNLIRFTTLPAVKAGWLVKAKDGWTLTVTAAAPTLLSPTPKPCAERPSAYIEHGKKANPNPRLSQRHRRRTQ